jgi:hypothetical protein
LSKRAFSSIKHAIRDFMNSCLSWAGIIIMIRVLRRYSSAC